MTNNKAMEINTSLLKEIEQFVTNLLLTKTPSHLVYHNVEHTREVVKNAELIAKHEGFSDDEKNILKTAAWFHDTGYIKKYVGHEEESVALANGFLRKKQVEPDVIELIANAIMATIYTRQPQNKIEGALCDADFMHLGKENYPEYAAKLREELNASGVRIIKKGDFEKESVEMFLNHRFYTGYGRSELTGIKEKNLENLKASIKERQKKKKKKATGKNTYSRGVDSMLKLTARNQINLSSIADNKSNILISLNGIIISLGLAGLVSKFKSDPAIILPTIIFLIFSLLTIVLAILSTRPNISSGKFTREDIEQKKVNLLFFGNFYNMQLQEYEWAIREMINDDRYLYSTMTKDQYYLGKVLARKYKLLRWAYNVFMVGVVVSVVAFLLVFLPV